MTRYDPSSVSTPDLPPINLPYGGYWQPAGHGWTWVNAQSASPSLVNGLVSGDPNDYALFQQMTNPSVFPGGGSAIPGDNGPFAPNGNYTGQYWPNADGTPGTRENPNYVPQDLPVQTVGLDPNMAPPITGEPFDSSATSGNGTPPPGGLVGQYGVNTGSMRDAEIAMITGPAEKAIIAHDNAAQMLAWEGSWVFSFDNQNVPNMQSSNGRGQLGPKQPTYTDQNPAASAQMRVYGEQVLNEVSAAAQLVGEYWRSINNGAQFFAAADKASTIYGE